MDTDDYYFMQTEQRPTNPIRSGDDDDDDEMEMMRGWVGGYGGYCTETKRLCAHIKSTDIETDRQTRITTVVVCEVVKLGWVGLC